MNKKIVIVLIFAVLVVGIFFLKVNTNEKITIDDKYYQNGNYIEVTNEELDNLDGNFIVFVHNGFCSMGVSCEEVFKEYMEEQKIDFLKIHIDYFKDSKYFDEVKYSPTVIIVSNNKVVAYLDANSDKDNQKYQDIKEFKKWISKYVN